MFGDYFLLFYELPFYPLNSVLVSVLYISEANHMSITSMKQTTGLSSYPSFLGRDKGKAATNQQMQDVLRGETESEVNGRSVSRA
jgi:hypothetical protein